MSSQHQAKTANTLSRRGFLKLIGAAGLSSAALPFVQPALAADAPKRVIFIVVPDGMRPDAWHPQGTETNFTLPAMTAPFESVKQHCLFLQGVNMYGSGSTHEGGVIKLLTGTAGQNQSIDVSLDYYLGQQFKSQTVKPHLNLNIVPKYHNKHITYDNNGLGVGSEPNPLAAYDSLFGSNNADPSTLRRISVLDKVRAEVNAMRSTLGTTEQQKLDAHLDSIREVEQRLQANSDGCPAWNFNPNGFTVTRTNIWQNPEFLDASRMQEISELHMDVALHALACDLTRVVTLKWSNTVNDQIIPESGINKTVHQASHEGGTSFSQIKAWYNQRVAYLIDRLANYPDGDGTLLDNTLIFLGSELGHGNWHDHNNMPFMLAGGAAGGIVTGRSLSYDGVAHNKLLVSIARYMGVNINSFGTEDDTPGPLAGLLG